MLHSQVGLLEKNVSIKCHPHVVRAPVGQQDNTNFKQNANWRALKHTALFFPTYVHGVCIIAMGKGIQPHFTGITVMSLTDQTFPDFFLSLKICFNGLFGDLYCQQL